MNKQECLLKKPQSPPNGLLLIVLVAIIFFCSAAGMFFVVKLIAKITNDIDKTVGAGIAAALITTFVSFPTFIFAKLYEINNKQLEVKLQQLNELRQKKTIAYAKLAKLFLDILKSIKTGTPTMDSLVDLIYECNQDLLIWGSDDVVLKFTKYRENVKDPNMLIESIENLFLSIRIDLGHSNENLIPGTLAKIFTDTGFVDRHTK